MVIGRNTIFKLLLLCAAFVIFQQSTANAYPESVHLQQEVTSSITGAYFSITNDQEDLVNNSSLFITKEMWLAFSSTDWIEVGTVRGVIDNPDIGFIDWNGHFMAWNYDSTYRERNFQTEYPTGTHNFEITNVNGTWTVYMDYTQVASIPTWK